MLLPSTSALFQKAGMLAADGRCKTLDSAADGYVRSEFCGLVVLSPLTPHDNVGSPDAHRVISGNLKADCVGADQPLGILVGTAVNQDGRSSSLTAPSGPAQQEVVAAALTAGSVGAHQVGYIQLHGTGTALGDPVEIDAASTALMLGSRGPGGDAAICNPLSLQAGKSTMGHAEPAAGIAGLLGALGSLGSALLQPVLHLRSMNTHVTAALQQHQRRMTAGIAAARQQAPALQSGSFGLAGCSAFAFQASRLNQSLCLHMEPVLGPNELKLLSNLTSCATCAGIDACMIYATSFNRLQGSTCHGHRVQVVSFKAQE